MRLYLALSAVPLVLAMTLAPAFAQSSTPNENTWVTNGSVYAIVPAGDTIYIGGDFKHVGPYTGRGVPLDASTGAPLTPFPKVNAAVLAVVSDGSGGWYIGGQFTVVGDVARNRLAHILSDGSVDTAWDPNADGGVTALAVSGNTVYVGGWFTSIGGASRNCIAALDAATGNATAWNPSANDSVSDLAVSGGTVYAGGNFTSIGGAARNRIAALDVATGNATAWNPNAAYAYGNASVYTLAVSGGTVYAGGLFDSIGGVTRKYIAAIDAATGAATAWDPNANWSVYTLAVTGGTVYAGGDFNTIGGATRYSIAALDAETGNATAWNPNPDSWENTVQALAVSGGTIYAGGYFTSIGGELRNNMAAFDAATGTVTSWDPSTDYMVHALAVSGGTVYAGGSFSSIGGVSRKNIAALTTATGTATAWNPSANNYVYAFAVSGGTVYVGGVFTRIGGVTRRGMAAVDAATGNVMAWDPHAHVSGGMSDPSVYTLAVRDCTVYAGGLFNSIGGVTRNYIAAIDAATGIATPWNPNANHIVSVLALSGGTVYAGGRFTSIGGAARNCIAALDAATGTATAWNPNACLSDGMWDPSVNTLALSGGTVYAGGRFTSIGGAARNYIAAVDVATGTATAWNPNAYLSGGISDPSVDTLAVSGGTVYAAGQFTDIGGALRNYIAALDATTGNATAWNPNAKSSVDTLAVSGGTVYAGGWFEDIGLTGRNYFARFDPTSSCTEALEMGSVSGLEIAATRSSVEGGWFFYFGLANNIYGNPLGVVNDNSNAFTGGASYTPAAVGVWVGRDSENFAIQAGDYVTMTHDGGQTKRVYFPAMSGGDDKYLYLGADGSTYWDKTLCDLAQAAPLCNEALEMGSVSGLEIAATRSSVEGGWFFYFGLANNIYGNPLGVVNDNSNAFTGGASYTPAAVGVWVGRDSEDFAIQAGDYVTMTYGGGQTKKIYFPAISGADDQTLYVGKDGSTYWDKTLCTIAQPAPMPEPICLDFKPAAVPTSARFPDADTGGTYGIHGWASWGWQ